MKGTFCDSALFEYLSSQSSFQRASIKTNQDPPECSLSPSGKFASVSRIIASEDDPQRSFS